MEEENILCSDLFDIFTLKNWLLDNNEEDYIKGLDKYLHTPLSAPFTSFAESLEELKPSVFEHEEIQFEKSKCSIQQNDPNKDIICSSVKNIAEIPCESNNDICMTEMSAKADVDEKAKEMRRVKNNFAAQKLREKKKYEEQVVIEREKELEKQNCELKRKAEMLQLEKRTILRYFKQYIEVLLNSSKEEIQKYLLQYATITDKYGGDNDLNDILGEVTNILKEAIDGHQNPCLIAGVIDELAMEQHAV